MNRGQIQIYTGDGKGKTTAALGLALRAICAGKKVFIGQFVKGMDYSELKAPDYLPGLELKQFGSDSFIYQKPSEEDRLLAQQGLRHCREIMVKGEHDLVILDELNIALYYQLFPLEAVLDLIKSKAKHQELIITGRKAPQALIDLADLVTEMKEVKHYYQKGLPARKGIEY
ncbi:MAG: cob(I)yrinic acid a,c-diamide adenosyltransferase [Bacillota bacterium]